MERLPLKVLLIEDDEDDAILVRELLSEVLTTRYAVTWAMSYEEALEATRCGQHDIFLVDYRLGTRDGLNFLQEMRLRGCGIPAILLTGQGSYEIDIEAMKIGASDYLLKGQINAALLERSIRYAIDRAKSEESLRKSEEQYRKLIDTALEGIWMVDETGKTTYVNQRMADMLGYTVQEILDSSPLTFVPDTERAEFEKRRELRKRGIGEQYDFGYRRKDGSDLFLIVNASPILDDRGEFHGTIAMMTDITGRKRAEDALKVSEEMMRLIIESSPIGIRICRLSRHVYVNPAFLRMFGYGDSSEIKGLAEEILFVPGERDRAQDELHGFESGWKPLSYETRGIKKTGEQFDLLVRSTRIDYQGEPAVLDFIIDVSAEKALQTKLLQAQKIHSIGTLAGGIAHDFNNILGIILGLTELAIVEAHEGSRLRGNLEHALEATHRGVELVNQILTFSRGSEQSHQPLHLAPLVKEALKLIRASIPSTIEIRQKIALTSGDDLVLSDPTQVHQILLNLCSNAAHAMRESSGGVLEIGLGTAFFGPDDAERPPDLHPGKYIRLSVSDTGHGIDPSIVDNIFDPYFTTKNLGEGTGLGLGVVHGIVKSHGGAVTVASKPGEGTTFNVYLPRGEGDVASRAEDLSSLPTGKESILLVDDEEGLVFAGTQILTRLGYKVTGKTSPAEALDTFLAQPGFFDLVITDQTMPQKTGLELASDILRVKPGMPIILCTGFSEIVTMEKAKITGIREFVVKPFIMRNMALTVRRVLDGEKNR